MLIRKSKQFLGVLARRGAGVRFCILLLSCPFVVIALVYFIAIRAITEGISAAAGYNDVL
jgi:hypothetical protein